MLRIAAAVRRTSEVFASGLATIATLAILLMLVIISANALARQFFGLPLSGAFEIGRALMPIVVFAGLPATLLRTENFSMRALRDRLAQRGPRAELAMESWQTIVGAALFCLLTWMTIPEAIDSIATREYFTGPVRVPLYYTRVIIAAGCAVTVLAFLARTTRQLEPSSPHR